MFKKLVIASNNQGKLREIQPLLAPLNIEVLPQSAFSITEAEEPHCTFIENALAKARHASLHSGLPALADDSGICVDALEGKPGVHSAYFSTIDNNEPRNDTKNNIYLLEVLKDQTHRNAHYYCALVLVRYHNDPQPIIAEGIWAGEILTAPRGTGSFGYDPIFLDVASGKTGAELSAEAKNKISHRGQALQQLIQKLKDLHK
ncbi:MAG: RdgB/HAM1 family non-canonical purine NTP pyrophosphatase [Methylotenera sp.]